MLTRAFVALALSVSLFAVAVSPARAAETTLPVAEVQWVHNVKANAKTATLLAKYRCWGGEGAHVWVSLKQGGGIDDLIGMPQKELEKQENTGGIAASWYEDHPENVVCNCQWQIQQFTVFNREAPIPGYHDAPYVPLTAGPAFLQFCVVESHGLGFLYTFVDVKMC